MKLSELKKKNISEMDVQSIAMADILMEGIAEEINNAVKHVTKHVPCKLDGVGELQFRNTVGTMQVRAHLFAGIRILQGSGMTDEQVSDYILELLAVIGLFINTKKRKAH